MQAHQAPPGLLGGRPGGHDALDQGNGLVQRAALLQPRRAAGQRIGLPAAEGLARGAQPLVEGLEGAEVLAGEQLALGGQRLRLQVDLNAGGQRQHLAGFHQGVATLAAQLEKALAQADVGAPPGAGLGPQPGRGTVAGHGAFQRDQGQRSWVASAGSVAIVSLKPHCVAVVMSNQARFEVSGLGLRIMSKAA